MSIIAHRINYPGALLQIDKRYTVGIRGTALYLLDPEANFFNHNSAISFSKIIEIVLAGRDYIRR